jgi:Uma2 family endonuclease
MTAIATQKKLMTTEELLAIPDDGIERWLIDGVLHERYPEIIGGQPMTVRNRFHSEATVKVSTELEIWLRSRPKPRGKVLAGEAGVRLCRDPDLTVGIDVVYVSADVAARESKDTKLVDGVPVLAVEILSPSDTQEDIHDKVKTYLGAGVPLVWELDPYDQTVKVHRAGAKPQMFNADQELTAEPHLPGFRVLVANFFE